MKPARLAVLALFAATPLLAQTEVDPRLERATRAALPVCSEVSIKWQELPVKLPARFTGALAKVESPSRFCSGEYPAILSPTGGFFFGYPWSIGGEEGVTIEAKLKNFAWRNLQENVTARIERKPNGDGLWPVTLDSMTEAGTLPMHGTVDPTGQMFFFGSFRKLAGDIAAQRAAKFDPFIAASPAKGAEGAKIIILEFSDFQCPSCRRSTGYADAILAKHGDKVRYIRYDVPLNGHPWAFPAALAGRAIHRQNPALFWEYKKAVYDTQDTMNAFMFWDWARAWAEDHAIDMTRYDADLASAEIRKQILDGAGLAFSNDVRATPTFMVNGAIIDYGEDGKDLFDYIDKLAGE